MYVGQRTRNGFVAMPVWAWVLLSPLMLCWYVMKAMVIIPVAIARAMGHGTRTAQHNRAVRNAQGAAWADRVPPWQMTPAMRHEDAMRGVQRPDWTHTQWSPR